MKHVKIIALILCFVLLYSAGIINAFARITPCTLVPDSDKHTVLDFFESVGAKEAVDIIKADKMKSTKLGNKLDATNLNNVMNALQSIKDVNEVRAKEAKLENRNLPELKVTHRLMANAIVNCNYSSFERGHANNYEKGYHIVAECLAWGYPDPALMWYNHPKLPEKEYFNQGKYNLAGHYINLYVDSKSYSGAHDYDLAGAGISMYPNVNKGGWCCCMITAQGYENDKAFSVDEYTKLVTDYIATITKTEGMKGDVTEDGSVLADDARLALRASAALDKLSESQAWAADVDEDDQVLADDARQILRFSAKIQSEFIKKK